MDAMAMAHIKFKSEKKTQRFRFLSSFFFQKIKKEEELNKNEGKRRKIQFHQKVSSNFWIDIQCIKVILFGPIQRYVVGISIYVQLLWGKIK